MVPHTVGSLAALVAAAGVTIEALKVARTACAHRLHFLERTASQRLILVLMLSSLLQDVGELI